MYKTTVRLYYLHWPRNSKGSRYLHRSMHGDDCHLDILNVEIFVLGTFKPNIFLDGTHQMELDKDCTLLRKLRAGNKLVIMSQKQALRTGAY
ncbi:hypothetical protein NC653_001704 [Populus alba x Populus x berolinensis]|uniref:Uncharacterized protein n=1 Tax=Populus alba x Populus x berolinensis TaxID=444605 RepID=A0AAD6RLS9_9ROSI|nr:hypothetical protein NC653_001704 [Populus alba x Populus x berolinensis]